jgi:hypothetical protein
VIIPLHRPLPDNTQHSQRTDKRASGGIQTHNLCKRAVAHPPLRPRGLCNHSSAYSWPLKASPGLRLFVAGLWPRRSQFDPRPVYVIFVVEKVALEHVFLQYLGFPLSVYCQCTVSVLSVYTQCTVSVLSVYCQCNVSVLSVYCQSTLSVLSVYCQCTVSVLSVYCHQCTTLIFIYMLLLPEGQTGEDKEPSKKQCSIGNGETSDGEVLGLVVWRFNGISSGSLWRAGIGDGDFHLLVIFPVMASLSSGNLPGGGNA